MRRIRNVRLPSINKQKLYYSTWQEKSTEYQTDKDGNVVYVTVNGIDRPIEKEIPAHFSQPIEFEASINEGGKNTQFVDFGVDNSEYSASIVTPKGYVYITETSLIWHESTPKYKKDGSVDEKSADYNVVKVSHSLIYDRYVLQKRVK